jgi:hypothetical protein
MCRGRPLQREVCVPALARLKYKGNLCGHCSSVCFIVSNHFTEGKILIMSTVITVFTCLTLQFKIHNYTKLFKYTPWISSHLYGTEFIV